MREAFIAHKERRIQGPLLDALVSYIQGQACTDDLNALLAGTFDFPLARQVLLRKTHSTRRRTIYIYPDRQNMLLKYVVWGMLEYDGIFYDSLYSFRRNVSVSKLFRRIAHADYVQQLHTLKADVRDYGHSIRPRLLVPMLENIVGERDPALLAFLVYLLERDEYLHAGVPTRGCMGGLPDVPVVCFFNNVYLMSLDTAMVARSTLYSRHADDICVFTATRTEVEDALAELRAITSGLELSLNESKTQLIEPRGSIELLGIQIRDAHLDVADNTVAKAKTRLSHFADKLVRREQRGKVSREEGARRLARRIDRYFYGDADNEHELSWRDFFFHVITRPDSLHEIDLVCQDLLRRVATGKRGDARYRFRYTDMQALGYRPLVHEYFRYREKAKGSTPPYRHTQRAS